MKVKSEEKTKSPTAAESKVIEDEKNLNDWTKQGNAVSAFNDKHEGYVQTDAKVDTKVKSEEKTKSPTAAESKVIEDEKNLNDWTKQGNAVPAFNDKHEALVQTDAKVNTGTDAERKAKQTTNTSAQVAADLEKEKSQELVKPHAPADSAKDTEPTNIQVKSEVNVEEKKWRWKMENWEQRFSIDNEIRFYSLLSKHWDSG